MNFIRYTTDSYKERVENVINKKKQEILSFFNIPNQDLSFNIYIYDDINSLKEGLIERGFKNDPDYMCAAFKDEDNSMNLFEPKDDSNPNEWSKDEYDNVIFHELIHAIEYNIYGSNKEWVSEGIAKYLDGTYSKGIKWLLENYINNNPIPEQIELEEEFGMHKEYDSYDYAYIMVSYLIETKGKEEFLNMLKNKSIDSNILNESIDYYNEKYELKSKVR